MKQRISAVAIVVAALVVPACTVVDNDRDGERRTDKVYVQHDPPTVIEKKTDVHVYEK